MSVQALGWVFNHSKSTGTARLVLLSIANHVDPDGEGWVHVKRVLAEAAVSLDSYRRAIAWAEEHGEIERLVQEGGSRKMPDRYRPNVFRFPALRPPQDATPSNGARPPQAAPPSTPSGPRRLRGGSEPSAKREPSTEPSTVAVVADDETPAPKLDRYADAKAIIDPWWEERRDAQNPVAQPYIACVKVVDQLLRNHIPQNRIEYALRHAPVVSAAALEMAIQRRLQEAGQRPGGTDRRSKTQRVLDERPDVAAVLAAHLAPCPGQGALPR